jgi:hypothetical protein
MVDLVSGRFTWEFNRYSLVLHLLVAVPQLVADAMLNCTIAALTEQRANTRSAPTFNATESYSKELCTQLPIDLLTPVAASTPTEKALALYSEATAKAGSAPVAASLLGWVKDLPFSGCPSVSPTVRFRYARTTTKHVADNRFSQKAERQRFCHKKCLC